MPRTEEQYKDIRGQKIALIKETALGLFAEKGFSSTPISAIAKKAGISKGLIYNYFTNKEDLIGKIMLEGIDEFMSVYDPKTEEAISEAKFKYFIDQTFEILKQNLDFWKLYFLVMMQPEVMKLVENKLMEYLLPFLDALSNYFESRGFENPMAHARLLGAILDGVSLNYIVDPVSFPIDDIKKLIIDKFL
ncbi:MAG: TetR/AcrR family transcriptional regulator [Chlorobi bacterium]|nr:TetR/AcrR family transcriptional regulator [Chlorobiota bacterium]